jgi:two-component system, chemotaxis family, sensor kinase Cph1
MNDVNKDPSFGDADLTNCDREPIHIPGSIQPHGVLLALDAQTLRVVQVGGDTERLLGATLQDLLGNTLEARVGPAALDHLKVMLAETPSAPRAMFAFETVVQHQGVTLDAIIHLNDGVIVVEFEPRAGNDTSNPLTLVQRMVARLQDADSLSASLQTIADEVHAVTGFDRVMVYQFQPDGSGEVVAETRAANVDSFLGLRYPASDIPAQARAVYLKNWMRLIPDARYKPALITPAINPVTSVPLNLTFSVLRSVSPLHLEYLANMGVRASMSLSLVIDGKLWGLIACHHREPRHLPHMRIICPDGVFTSHRKNRSRKSIEAATRPRNSFPPRRKYGSRG